MAVARAINLPHDIVIGRINPNSTIDVSYGSSGFGLYNFIGSIPNDQNAVLGVQSSGRIITAGEAGGDIAVRRLNENGTGDNSFGSFGTTTVNVNAEDHPTSLFVDVDDNIYILCTSDVFGNSDISIIKLDEDGTLDPSFGTGGRRTFDISADDKAGEVLVQPDGTILISGGAGDDFVVLRLLDNGNPDPSFSVRWATIYKFWRSRNRTIY